MGRPKKDAVDQSKPETVRAGCVLLKRDYLHAQYLHSLTDSKKNVMEEAFSMYYSTMLPKLDLPA